MSFLVTYEINYNEETWRGEEYVFHGFKENENEVNPNLRYYEL